MTCAALLAAVPAPGPWWIDAALGGLLALALVFGAFNGLSGEAARLVAFAVAPETSARSTPSPVALFVATIVLASVIAAFSA